jgi:hypothetical protein
VTSLLLSVDELRAAARLAGVPVPPLVAEDDPDDPRVDLAALRGLAARGLVVGLAEADPEPAGILAAALAALDEPTWLLDVELDTSPEPLLPAEPRAGSGFGGPGRDDDPRHGLRQWNEVQGPGGSASMTALLGGLVHIHLDAERHGAAELADRCGLPDHVATDDIGFEVAVAGHVDADALALQGDLDGAVTILADCGVPVVAARQWVDAVASRRSAAAVRLVRRLDQGVAEVRELRWLVGGDGEVWQVDAGLQQDAAHVRRVSAGHLRAELADVLGPPVASLVGTAAGDGQAGEHA